MERCRRQKLDEFTFEKGLELTLFKLTLRFVSHLAYDSLTV
jgi:hypothetical protein